jgi:hypothetical protein
MAWRTRAQTTLLCVANFEDQFHDNRISEAAIEGIRTRAQRRNNDWGGSLRRAGTAGASVSRSHRLALPPLRGVNLIWEKVLMIIGVPKEIKDHETRVGLVPSGVSALREAGHEVLVQTQAGEGSSITDREYMQAGAPTWW